MLDRGVLSRLHCLTEQESFTLTLYVDIDQNKQSNRNRGFVVQTEAMLKELRGAHAEDEALRIAARRALQLMESLDPNGQTALAVVHPGIGLAEVHQIRVPLLTSTHWRRGAFLRPVVEAMDDFERYAVVLTDKQRARLFTLYMGELVEHSDLLSETAGRTRTTGTDQWWSQARFQRHHDQEVALHAKKVVDALHDLALTTPCDRLIVAGPTEAASQVTRLLPKRLRGKLVEAVAMPVTASRAQILERVRELIDSMERRHEVALVEGLLAEHHAAGKAVVGMDDVVAATNRGRVWKLVYTKGYKCEGTECRGCGSFAAARQTTCDVCGAELHAIPAFVDRLSQGVIEAGGQVEVVSGPAAELMARHGPIAALLRY